MDVSPFFWYGVCIFFSKFVDTTNYYSFYEALFTSGSYAFSVRRLLDYEDRHSRPGSGNCRDIQHQRDYAQDTHHYNDDACRGRR